MKYSSKDENNSANKPEFKEYSQRLPKAIAKKNKYKLRIDQFVTKQIRKIKQLAAVYPGKDENKEGSEQCLSSNKEKIQGLCEKQVQEVKRTFC